MRSIFFIIPAALIFQLAGAQNGPAPSTVSQGTFAAITVTSLTPVTLTDPTPSTESSDNYLNYKSVYEASTLEEEVQMATERFSLTKSQKEVWMLAAVDRRKTEKEVYAKLSSKETDYSKDAAYRGLRISHNTFHEIIEGYLSPYQKQSLELDREILIEKQRRVAKIPPPAPPVIVVPVDSTLIKEQILKEAEKIKAEQKKSKSKKKKKSGS